MKYLFLIFLFLGAQDNVIGQIQLSIVDFNPSKDPDYKPKIFEEAILQLDIVFPDSIKQQIKNIAEDEFVRITHFTTGMWIRNEWLYKRRVFRLIVRESDLKKDLASKGLFHNDDMSTVVLRSFHRYLNNQNIDLDSQIKQVHESWNKIIQNRQL